MRGGTPASALWSLAWPVARPILHALDPERAHDLTLRALAVLPLPAPRPDDPRLAVDAFGLRFPNPVGLAAGFDKNGALAGRAGSLGFGFAEIGTLTPLPQIGNSRPRLFRLAEHGAVINRFGFNNGGHDHVLPKLRPKKHGARPEAGATPSAILGINVGANKASADRVTDYVTGVRTFAHAADYFTINVSSPNTPNLRDLQKADALDDLLARVLDARDEAGAAAGSGSPARPPILLKIAPDLLLAELDAVVAVARRRRIDGMIVSNTTTERPATLGSHRHRAETGGLSGRPLFEASTRKLAQAYLRIEGQFPLVGVGGVENAATAFAKIAAGARLVQLYSALVFAGPSLVARIKAGLLDRLGKEETLATVVGRDAAEWGCSD